MTINLLCTLRRRRMPSVDGVTVRAKEVGRGPLDDSEGKTCHKGSPAHGALSHSVLLIIAFSHSHAPPPPHDTRSQHAIVERPF